MEPQWSQALRPTVPTVHADARRLRLFDFDIFFFGTAMADRLPTGRHDTTTTIAHRALVPAGARFRGKVAPRTDEETR